MIERLQKIVVLPVLLLSIACADEPSPGPVRPAVGSVAVNPDEPSLLVGKQVRLFATAKTIDGDPLPGREISWSSERAVVAGVSADGMVTAFSAGTTYVVATSEGRAGRARVIVSAPAPAPSVVSLSPDNVVAGATVGVQLSVMGAGFTHGSVVRANGAPRQTEYVSATELRTTLGPDDVATPRVLAISVQTPAPGGGASGSLAFTVRAAERPAPTVTSLAPAAIPAGWNGSFTVTVRGSGFAADSRLTWNGAARDAVVVSGEEIRFTVTPPDVANPGSAEVAVVVPAPGGGRATATFTVHAPQVARVDLFSPWGATWTWGQDRLPLQAVARNAGGSEMPGRIDRWSVSDERVALLAPTGPGTVALYGVAPGHAAVSAAAGTVQAQREVTVFAAPRWDLLFDVDHPSGRRLMRWSPGNGVAPVALPTGLEAMDPSPSPDGARIAFIGWRSADLPDLFVANADGTGARAVAASAAIEMSPAWSPDGQRIAFASNRDGNLDIFTVAPDGSDLTRLTSASATSPSPGSGNAAGAPAWSPFGDRLAYVVSENGRSTVWIMNADGSGKRQLTTVPAGMSADDLDPAWDPDGLTITLRRTLNPGRQTALVSVSAADGSRVFTFIDQVDGTTPAYSPDGSWLTLTSTGTTLPGVGAGALVAMPLVDIAGRRVVMDPSPLSGTAVSNAVWMRRR